MMFLEEGLRTRGFRHRPMGPDTPGTKIWSHPEFDPVVIVRGIEVPPGPLDPSDIDEFFQKLQERLENMKKNVSHLVFQGGGSVRIPKWFHDWCQSRSPPIDVRIVDSENAHEVAALIGRRPTQRRLRTCQSTPAGAVGTSV
jgi:hypothetical protein